MIKLVIFDLDGTLINSIEDLADAMNYALDKHHFPLHEREAYNYFVGDGIALLINRALPEAYRNPETEALIRADFSNFYAQNYAGKTYIYAGIPETLAKLREQGIRLAVASNKPNEFTKLIVRHFFGTIFSAVYGNRSDVPKKPDPQIAVNIMQELGISPAECLFVGDTNVDIYTAKAAGMRSAGCLWGFRDRQELTEAGADYILDEPEALLHCI